MGPTSRAGRIPCWKVPADHILQSVLTMVGRASTTLDEDTNRRLDSHALSNSHTHTHTHGLLAMFIAEGGREITCYSGGAILSCPQHENRLIDAAVYS